MGEITQLSILKSSLIGKKVTHRNRYNRTVSLEVEDIKIESGSRELEESTRENDWWPATESWSHYYLCFVDGSKIQFEPNTTFIVTE